MHPWMPRPSGDGPPPPNIRTELHHKKFPSLLKVWKVKNLWCNPELVRKDCPCQEAEDYKSKDANSKHTLPIVTVTINIRGARQRPGIVGMAVTEKDVYGTFANCNIECEEQTEEAIEGVITLHPQFRLACRNQNGDYKGFEEDGCYNQWQESSNDVRHTEVCHSCTVGTENRHETVQVCENLPILLNTFC